jgi:hypothetical protein
MTAEQARSPDASRGITRGAFTDRRAAPSSWPARHLIPRLVEGLEERITIDRRAQGCAGFAVLDGYSKSELPFSRHRKKRWLLSIGIS